MTALFVLAGLCGDLGAAMGMVALDGGEDEGESEIEAEGAGTGDVETGWSESAYSSAVGVAMLRFESDPPSLEAELAAICMDGDGDGRGIEGIGVVSDEPRRSSSSSVLSFMSSSCTEEANEPLRSASSPSLLMPPLPLEKSDEQAELEVLEESVDESEPSESARSRTAWGVLVDAMLLMTLIGVLIRYYLLGCMIVLDDDEGEKGGKNQNSY